MNQLNELKKGLSEMKSDLLKVLQRFDPEAYQEYLQEKKDGKDTRTFTTMES